MPWCGTPFTAQGVKPNNVSYIRTKLTNPPCFAAISLCPGLQLPIFQCFAPCKFSSRDNISSQKSSIKRRIVLACHLQHSITMPVSAIGYHPTQAQPPPFLTTSTGAVIKVKHKESGHKWLGCMLSAAGSKNATLDIDYHLQSASRAFFANKLIFLSRNMSIRNRLKFFDAIVTPIACFGAGPRCIHSADMV